MEYNFIDILIYFITYSFLGWVMESIFRSVCEKKLINTGFLKGPFCPIYGIGAIIMILFLKNSIYNMGIHSWYIIRKIIPHKILGLLKQ